MYSNIFEDIFYDTLLKYVFLKDVGGEHEVDYFILNPFSPYAQ